MGGGGAGKIRKKAEKGANIRKFSGNIRKERILNGLLPEEGHGPDEETQCVRE